MSLIIHGSLVFRTGYLLCLKKIILKYRFSVSLQLDHVHGIILRDPILFLFLHSFLFGIVSSLQLCCFHFTSLLVFLPTEQAGGDPKQENKEAPLLIMLKVSRLPSLHRLDRRPYMSRLPHHRPHCGPPLQLYHKSNGSGPGEYVGGTPPV